MPHMLVLRTDVSKSDGVRFKKRNENGASESETTQGECAEARGDAYPVFNPLHPALDKIGYCRDGISHQHFFCMREPTKTLRSMHKDPNCISNEPLESLWSASGDRVMIRQDVADLGCRSIVNGTLDRSRCAFGPSSDGQH